MCTEDELMALTYEAAKAGFESLFLNHKESFYYLSLFTDGLANGPAMTAWSREALSKAVADHVDPAQAWTVLKWSYCESPYFCYRDDLFEPVRRAFQNRPGPDSENWDEEYTLRLRVMEQAMHQLDNEGFFGKDLARQNKVIVVEVMPPDATNTDRARRLNPPEALREWLAENDNE